FGDPAEAAPKVSAALREAAADIAGQNLIEEERQRTRQALQSFQQQNPHLTQDSAVVAAAQQVLYEQQAGELAETGVDFDAFVKAHGRYPTHDEISRAHESLRASRSPHASPAAVLLEQAADRLSTKFHVRRSAQTPEQARSSAVLERKNQHRALRG